VGITGGGCSGFEYNIDLVGFGDPSPKDIIWDQTDPIPGDHADAPIRIAVDPVSAQYLKGCVIDYVRDGLQSGFRFANPMAKAQCGCGRSFSA
jgi:iron-sulfur cluster assembly protein